MMRTGNNATEDKTMKKVTVKKMACRELSGDWHDAPLKWTVDGPNTECQKFSTKKDALEYAKARRHSETQQEAMKKFSLSE